MHLLITLTFENSSTFSVSHEIYFIYFGMKTIMKGYINIFPMKFEISSTFSVSYEIPMSFCFNMKNIKVQYVFPIKHLRSLKQ